MKCGTRKKLTFDLIIPDESINHHEMEWSWRISFYRAQHFKHSNLQLLCEKDNSAKNNGVFIPYQLPLNPAALALCDNDPF